MSFGHFHMGLRWIDLWVTVCLGLGLWSPLAPNVHSYAVDAIISSQVLPLPSASVRCSPKPIQYANMYFHYWLHWMNDRIIVIDDATCTRRSVAWKSEAIISQIWCLSPKTNINLRHHHQKQSIGLRSFWFIVIYSLDTTAHTREDKLIYWGLWPTTTTTAVMHRSFCNHSTTVVMRQRDISSRALCT